MFYSRAPHGTICEAMAYPLRHPIEAIAYANNPPFTHLELCWNPAPLASYKMDRRNRGVRPDRNHVLPPGFLRYTTILTNNEGVVCKDRAFRNPDFYWVRISCSVKQLACIDQCVHDLAKMHTTFDLAGMFKALIGSPRPPPGQEGILTQTSWFCSQMISRVLQEANLLFNGYNASNIHPTDLFVILILQERNRAVPRPIPFPPDFTPPVDIPPLATYVYTHSKGTMSISHADMMGISEIMRYRRTRALEIARASE